MKKLFAKKGRSGLKEYNKGFVTFFGGFLVGFLLSFFLCWETILYIINLFQMLGNF